MDINDIYSDIAGFWERIFPIIVAHILALFLLKYVGRFKLNIYQKIENFIKTERYSKIKSLLVELNMWTKVPYIIIILILIYLTLFNSLIEIQSNFYFPSLEITYSEPDIWYSKKTTMIPLLVKIGSYSRDTTGNPYIIYELKQKYLEEYQNKYPELYNSRIGWIKKSFNKYYRYYNFLITFIMLILLLLFLHFKKYKFNDWGRFFRLITIFIIAIIALFVLRMKIEERIETQIEAEVHFTSSMLENDQEKQSVKLRPEQIKALEKNLTSNFEKYYYFPHTFWLLRSFRDLSVK